MRWPWRHREVTADPKAQEAVAVAEALFREQEAYNEQVDLIAARLAERRHQNRFAELVEHALQSRRGQT